MIEVNLLYDRSVSKQKDPAIKKPSAINESTAFKDIFDDDALVAKPRGQGQLDTVLKIIIIMIFTLALYGYEHMQMQNNKEQISAKQMEAEEVKNLLEAKKNSVDGLETLKKRLMDERDFIEAVRKELILRMHFVRGLDSIQTAMVSNLWLTLVSYEKGAFRINGQVLYKADLDKFYTELNKIPFFNKAIIVKDSEVKTQNAGTFEFTILTETKKEALGGA